ncbi:hypothetical protein G4B88_015453 [Cannabis sativa]|uniref:Major facilitator superfamily (MFS) profile domain-containing protein n=1 Tax=Cannabis sativa TaxID=3483 RepID=A0A7J6DP95_CANSA|nr:hypothetical protein G4B88_015453 [Cannabis sativa]
MAIGGMVVSNVGRNYEGSGLNAFVVVTCLVAAMGGLIFGYDLGISAALVASFVASVITRSCGRKVSMLIGGVVFFIGSILNGAAANIKMLIIGRLLLAKMRGALNIGFQMAITIGILVANFVNYGTAQIKGGWGWRVSLGLAAVQAVMLTVGAIFLPDTPNSILERGNHEEAKRTKPPRRSKIHGRTSCCLMLFKTLGFGDNASLISSAITGVVNVLATIVSIVSVDRFGRRVLFLEVAAFAWSWGPLGWLVPSEICPLEIRSAAQAINVSVNMFFTFIIAQVFLSMLCHMKFGLFFFFAGFVIIMTVFIYFFLPETKNLPIEEMNRVWKAHWF